MTGKTGEHTPPSARELLGRALHARDRAALRVIVLRRTALRGSYDSAEFDQAIIAYRHATAAVLTAARRTFGEEPVPAAPAAPDRIAAQSEADTAFAPTARMRFAKWLVASGRLSDGYQDTPT